MVREGSRAVWKVVSVAYLHKSALDLVRHGTSIRLLSFDIWARRSSR